MRASLLFLALLLTAACGQASQATTLPTLPDPASDERQASAPGREQIVLAGGCFWGVEAVFAHVKGVSQATSGYAGGAADTANYEAVSTGTTGHAESVQVTYDPSQVTLGQLLKIYFAVAHDPTELNRQGPDHGTQYRSAIFTSDAAQENIANAYIAQLQNTHVFMSPVVTQVTKLDRFYPAEDYHQDYLRKHPYNPYIMLNDAPKVAALKAQFPALYKD